MITTSSSRGSPALSDRERDGLRSNAIRAWNRTEVCDGSPVAVARLLDRVNQVVAESLERPQAAAGRPGVALIALHGSRLTRTVHDAVESRVGRVLGAADGPTALGLAIVHQPDVAVLGADLIEMNGRDTALVISMYAPRTRILLIGGHRWRLGPRAGAGISVVDPESAEPTLIDAIGRLCRAGPL
jgi:hypothetical protein